MMRATLLLALVALATVTRAATLSVGPPALDAYLLGSQFPPALEADPGSADRAFVACSEGGLISQRCPGVILLRTAPGEALAQLGSAYLLPGNLNCSESSPFLVPRLGGFSLEPQPGSTRGWLTTSSCELLSRL